MVEMVAPDDEKRHHSKLLNKNGLIARCFTLKQTALNEVIPVGVTQF